MGSESCSGVIAVAAGLRACCLSITALRFLLADEWIRVGACACEHAHVDIHNAGTHMPVCGIIKYVCITRQAGEATTAADGRWPGLCGGRPLDSVTQTLHLCNTDFSRRSISITHTPLVEKSRRENGLF